MNFVSAFFLSQIVRKYPTIMDILKYRTCVHEISSYVSLFQTGWYVNVLSRLKRTNDSKEISLLQ